MLSGQVANFKTNSNIPIEKFAIALNSNLKKSILIKDAEEVDERFHSRLNCKRKTYRYVIDNSKYGSAIYRNLETHIPVPLDIEKMKKAVKYFEGEIKSEFISDKNSSIAILAEDTKKQIIEKFNKYEIAEAANSIVDFADRVNKYVTENAPWQLAKEEKYTQCGQVIYNTLESMRYIALFIYPYCPNIAKDILKQLNQEEDFKYSKLQWGAIKEGKITEKEKIKPVFLRLDSEFALDKKRYSN